MPRKRWILGGDIQGCSYLSGVLGDFPVTPLIERWLNLEKNLFYGTDTGVLPKKKLQCKEGQKKCKEGPQANISLGEVYQLITPLLANRALDGLEKEIGSSRTGISGEPRAFVRYADHFVVLCETEKDCHKVKEEVERLLLRRGIRFSDEKTFIKNIEEGFDFLGTTIRSFYSKINVPGQRGITKMGYKLIIQPFLSSQAKYRIKLKEIFTSHHGKSVDQLIRNGNPVIRSWGNYHRKFSSRKVFEKMDLYLFLLQNRFGYRTHPNKGKGWVVGTYFGTLSPSHPTDRWVFGNKKTKYQMIKHRWVSKTPPVSLLRHDLVANKYSPDDPAQH